MTLTQSFVHVVMSEWPSRRRKWPNCGRCVWSGRTGSSDRMTWRSRRASTSFRFDHSRNLSETRRDRSSLKLRTWNAKTVWQQKIVIRQERQERYLRAAFSIQRSEYMRTWEHIQVLTDRTSRHCQGVFPFKNNGPHAPTFSSFILNSSRQIKTSAL